MLAPMLANHEEPGKAAPRRGQVGKEPLIGDARRRVLEAARCMKQEGVDAYHVIAFLMFTGAHPSVLANRARSLPHLEADGDERWISWLRPKKTGADAVTRVPVAMELQPWVQEFFDSELPTLPTWRQFYWQLCRAVGKKAGIPGLSPMTLRHTFGVYLDELGMSPSEIQRCLNCSLTVLTKRYTRRQDAVTAKRLREAGF